MLMSNLKFIEHIHVWQVLCGLLDYQSNCFPILKQIHMYFNVTRVLHPYYNYSILFLEHLNENALLRKEEKTFKTHKQQSIYNQSDFLLH